MTNTGADTIADTRGARRLVQAAGLIFYLLAVQALVTSGVGVHVYLSGGSAEDLLLPALSAVLAVCYGAVGYHLRRHSLWARNFAFAFGVVGLFAYPIGTFLGALVILFIDRANRARLFTRSPRRSAPSTSGVMAEDEALALRFEPDLAAERLG